MQRNGLRSPRVIVILALLLVIPSQSTSAHDGATGVVKSRMDAMSTMADSMKALAAVVRGKAPYDRARAHALISAISVNAGSKLPALFPEGSAEPPSAAKAEVWRDWTLFVSLAEELSNKAREMNETAAAGPTPEFRSAFKNLGKTCAGCHKLFRTKK